MWFHRQRVLLSLGFVVSCFYYFNSAPEPGVWAQVKAAISPPDAWVYPVSSQEVLRDFLSPNGDYSAGHRGVDFATVEGESVLAVAAGTVRFAGQVAGRGVVSLTLADGYVAEVEPVCALVTKGDQVATGQQIGTLCGEGSLHCHDSLGAVASCLHLSARRFSPEYSRGYTYLSPLLFLRAFAPSHLVAIDSLD